MSDWRYAQNGQTLGPVETPALIDLLRSGGLPGNTLVWTSGMAEWAPASSIPEISGTMPSGAPLMPPPLQGSTPPGIKPPPLSDAADVDQNKIFAVLAYLGILFLIPLLAAPQSRFARYHTNQGIVLFLATLVVCGSSVVLAIVPLIGCIAWMLPFVAMIGALVFMVMGIINAASGQCKPLPLIGHFEVLSANPR